MLRIKRSNSVERDEEGIPQGLKPRICGGPMRPKAEALGYLEAESRWRCSIRRFIQGLVVCLLAVVMLGADSSSRFNRLGHQMMCACGCGQVLLECNHVGCPDSDRMIGELRGQLGGGGGTGGGGGLSDTAILNWFAAKYGATILAAPIRGGFDNVAWIAPIAVFILATLGTAMLVRVWALRSSRRVPIALASGAAGGDVAGEAMRERIRRETEY
jgi:cytochrome c-type biogenesis protein CcmH/NrfF